MGKPAARIGDMTAHGGCIVVGCPTVLIGGMPAARATDMHVCPMLTVLVPHVGGPIAMGSAGVLIGGMPAARMGDMAVCVGPPDVIILGCMTVLIGEVSPGSAKGGSGGGGGSPAAVAAQMSAATALTDNNETATKIEHWVEFEFVDKAGNPVSGIPYKFTDPDGNESEAVLRLDGTIRRDALSAGQCKAVLFGVSNAKWSKDKANVGEKVKMSAEVEGFEDETPALFQIFKRDLKGADVVVDEVKAEVKGVKVEGEWEYVYPEDMEEYEQNGEEQQDYRSPQYYFEAIVEHCKARSGLLDYKDWVEIELKDEDDNPIGNEEYILFFSTGEVRKGKLDSNGKKREEKVPPVSHRVEFPHFSSVLKMD